VKQSETENGTTAHGEQMDCVFHLTPQGWREDTCAENERLETWKVETEHFSSSRVTRWGCIWRATSLDMEARRLLHRRFGSPPTVTVPMETDSEGVAVDATVAIAV
jgi:hypothetical protein